MKTNCCICGQDINSWNYTTKTYQDQDYKICMACLSAIDKVNSKEQQNIDSGINYFRNQLDNNKTSREAIPLVKYILGEDEPVKNVNSVSKTSSRSRIPSQGSEVSSSVPLFAGIVFLVLAVILYFVSVNNDYGVANIQSTVFSAASFIAAIVCFAAARIINAVNSK